MPVVRIAPLLAAVLGLAPAALAQVSLASLDTFEDGSLSGWLGATRSNALGGPAGAADRYLRVDNGGTGQKVATFNADARWSGDFQSARVTAIQADLTNFGPASMEIRLALFGGNAITGGGRWTSSTAVVLAPNSGWRTVTFNLDQPSLTSVLGSVPYPTLMATVTQIMFRHDPGTPSSGGAAGDGLIGIDNVRAIPTPGAGGVLLLGAGWLGRRRR